MQLRQITHIQNRIYEIRDQRVMLDRDLAELYETATKVLNLTVKRHIRRFPEDFMFRLTKEEYDAVRQRMELLDESDGALRFQSETLKTKRGSHPKYLPYAFTEQGVAMLSGILNSEKAINMNIAIMRAFVDIRKTMLQNNDVIEKLREIQSKISEHDGQLSQIYDAIENLLDEKAAQRKWAERDKIGFKNH